MAPNTKKPLFSILVAAIIAILTVTTALADIVTIDHFFNTSGSDFTLTANSASAVTGFLNGAEFSDQRDFVVTRTGGSGGISAFIPSASDYMLITSDADTTGTVQLTWDAVEAETAGNASAITHRASPTDLQSPNNFSFHFEILQSNMQSAIQVQAYSGAANCSTGVINVPNGITPASHVDLNLFYSAMAVCGGLAPANFTQITAIRMTINANNPGTILEMHLVEATSKLDHGDLPISYGTPRHSSAVGTRLGPNADTEDGQQYSANATGDNLLQSNDEDGVSRTPGWLWSPGTAAGGAGGKVNLDVRFCVGSCAVVAWFDWDRDGSFDNNPPTFIQAVGNGVQTVAFDIPTDVAGTPVTIGGFVPARFRLFLQAAGTISNPSYEDDGFGGGANSYYVGGEVEDYYWQFSPTAITLQTLEARSGNQTLQTWIWLGIVALIGLAGIGSLLDSRRQTLQR